jgi:hypothetical protein
MRKVLRAVCTALFAAWLVPAAQAAAPPFRPIGTGYSQMYADGLRFAFTLAAPLEWESPLRVRVFDMLRDTSHDLALPARCGFADFASGQLLQSCPVEAPSGEPPRPDQPVVTDLASGTERRPDVSHIPAAQSSTSHVYFFRVGTRWLAGARSGDHSYDLFYLEIDTSRVVNGAPARARQTIDLDRRSLVRDLCRPLTRRRNPGYGESMQTSPLDRDRWLPYVFDRPFGLAQAAPWRLGRCGSRRSVTICRGDRCFDVQLGGGIVTWRRVDRLGRSTLYAYDAPRRRRWQWGPFPADGSVRLISHAGRWVFLSVGGEGEIGPHDLFRARLPRR